MKKRIILTLSTIVCALILCAVGIWGLAPATARADEKEIAEIISAENEFLYYGDIVKSTATVKFTDDSTEARAIKWDNLSSVAVNRNFAMTEAIGTVEGTDEVVTRKFFTLPRGLVYFVNCGSLTDQPITEAGNFNDVYYGLNTAIIENYEAPTSSGKLLNQIADQEYTGGATWGYTSYTAGYPVSSKQMPAKAGDPMPPDFPYNAIRSSDAENGRLAHGIEYTLGGLESGKSYKLYIGTRSHWHSRNVTPVINGAEQDKFGIDAVAKITTYENVSPNGSNQIVFHLKGGGHQDEANIAFIAVQTMEAANATASEVPEALVREENLDMGVTEFTVENATVGTKVQVSLDSGSYNILYEEIVTEENVGDNGLFTIKAPAGAFDGAFALRLTAINSAGPSKSIVIFITDITDYYFTPRSTDFTTESVTFDIHGEADSNIMKLVVTYDYVDTTITAAEDPNLGDSIYNGTYTVSENGVYTFTLYSGNDAFVSVDYEVKNIDKEDVTLSVNLATSGITAGKTRVTLAYTGATGAVGYTVYGADGVKIKSGDNVRDGIDLESGRYSFSVVSESGKTATASVLVSDAPVYSKVSVTSASGGKTYTLEGNGKEITRIYGYGVADGAATRLMGTGNAVSEYSGAAVYAKIEYKDGTVEIARLDGAAASGKKSGCGCGSAVGFADIVAAAVLLAAAVCVTFVRRKPASQK